MQDYQPIIDYFSKVQPLEKWEEELICNLFEVKELRWHELALKQGEICKYFYFVVKGCLRMYQTDTKGNIHIVSFASENWIVLDIISFREQKPATMNIDALEKTTILQITNENLKHLYHKAPKFNYIIRELLEKHTAFLQQRLLQTMCATAQERYQTFISMYPHLPKRISHTQIAYYLGITPEFLSKIRSQHSKS